MILALDASSTSLGFVVGDAETVAAHGTVKLHGALDARLVQMHMAVCDLLQIYNPDKVLMERGAGAHVNSVRVQAHAHGVIRLVCALREVKVEEVSAAAGKKALAGKGNVGKAEMVEAARAFLAGEYDEHAADALGLLKAATA